MALLPLLLQIVPLSADEEWDVVVNELMINPRAVYDSRGEWIELYNRGASEVDLSGWTVSDGARDSFTIDEPLLIGSGEYVLLARSGDMTRNGGVVADYVYRGMNLVNTGDCVMLLDLSGRVADEVCYSKESFILPIGCSIELIHPSMDNANGDNWAISTATYGDGDRGTPGGQNSVYFDPSDVTPMAYPPQLLVFGHGNDIAVSAYSEEIVALMESVSSLEGTDYCEAVEHLSEASVLVQRMSAIAHGLTAIRAHALVPAYEQCVSECRELLASTPPMEQDEPPRSTALFCDNKGQYYHHGRAGLLCTLLSSLGLDMVVQNTGLITLEALIDHELVILTNPQEPFMGSEVDAVQAYLSQGGKLLVTGQYYKYVMAGELNAITSPHGILFTETEVVDYESNTGKHYYPLITSLDEDIFPEGVQEVHYAYGCALAIEDAYPLICAEGSAQVCDSDGTLLEGLSPVLAALSKDGSVLALSSSTIVTTSLFRGDNYDALTAMLSLLLDTKPDS